MKVKILGTGCPGCQKLEENTIKALKELGVKAEITKVTDMTEIVDYGVMRTPAIVVGEEVVLKGRLAGVDELKEILKEYC